MREEFADGASQRSIDNRDGCHCCGEDCPGDYCLKCKLADCKPFGRCDAGLITDGGRERDENKASHYVLVAGLIVGTTGLILSASLQAWTLVLLFGIGLTFLLYVRTEYEEAFTHGA